MSERVELSIQLSHSDGLRVKNKSVYLFKGHASGGTLALQGREGVSEHLVTLGLA